MMRVYLENTCVRVYVQITRPYFFPRLCGGILIGNENP